MLRQNKVGTGKMLRTKLWILTLGTVFFAWYLNGCGGPNKVQGEYEVNGANGATLATVGFALPSGATTNAVSVTLPWSYTFTGYETEGPYQGTTLSLSAQNDSNSGSVSVVILQNGSVYEQSWATWPTPAVTIVGNY